MAVVQVNLWDPEALETGIAGFLGILGRAVDLEGLLIYGKLCGEEDVVALVFVGSEPFAQKDLVVAIPSLHELNNRAHFYGNTDRSDESQKRSPSL